MQRLSYTCIAFLLTLFLISHAKAIMDDDLFNNTLKGISSADEIERGNSFSKLEQERQKIIWKTFKKLDKAKKLKVVLENSEEHYAVKLLISWRALMAPIDLRIQPQEGNVDTAMINTFPFAEALAKIGQISSLNAISHKMVQAETPEDQKKLYSWVIYKSLDNNTRNRFMEKQLKKYEEGSPQMKRLLNAKKYIVEGDNIFKTIKRQKIPVKATQAVDKAPLNERKYVKNFNKLEEKRRAVIAYAMEIVKGIGDKKTIPEDSKEHYAIRLLREWVAEESVDVLLDNIDLRLDPQNPWRGRQDRDYVFPSLRALGNIGGRELPIKLSHHLANETSDEKRRYYKHALYGTLGKELYEQLLNIEAQKYEEGSAQKERLLKAKEYAVEKGSILPKR